jgi:hypothetical protein
MGTTAACSKLSTDVGARGRPRQRGVVGVGASHQPKTSSPGLESGHLRADVLHLPARSIQDGDLGFAQPEGWHSQPDQVRRRLERE